jgi:hypothetical protein
MIAYFFLGVLIGVGFPLWVNLVLGGIEHIRHGLLWGLVSLTLAMTFLLLGFRLKTALDSGSFD